MWPILYKSTACSVHTGLVGGDWVYCKESSSRMTISFFLKGPDDKTYGMACGHIVGSIPEEGGSLFVMILKTIAIPCGDAVKA